MAAPKTPFVHFLRLGIALALVFAVNGCGAAIPAISGTAYYVDCDKGNDANPGTSVSQAWETIEKVNEAVFSPGDGVFLQRGITCPGALRPKGSGDDGQPITIGAYGRGLRPLIDGGKNVVALELFNQQYWHIQDIEFTGGIVFGIHITGDETGESLNHFRLTNLVVHDVYGGEVKEKVSGLVVLSLGGENNTLNDVIVDGVTAYNTNQYTAESTKAKARHEEAESNGTRVNRRETQGAARLHIKTVEEMRQNAAEADKGKLTKTGI